MAAPNFIMADNTQLRATQFNPGSQYDIGEMNFYIPFAMASDSQVFLILKGEKGLIDIVELNKVGSQGSNILYKLSLNQKLRIAKEKVLLKMLVLNPKDGTYKLSSGYSVNISTEHYELARQVYIAQCINASTQSAYAKILALTEENRAIYEKIKERG